MTYNTELITAQASFLPDVHHVIQVTSYSGGHGKNGQRLLSTDPNQTRQYRCLIQPNENTAWTVASDTDAFPYMAYILSIPIGATDAYMIRVEEQLTIITFGDTTLTGTVRRMGGIKSYPDQYGNLFAQVITFQ